MLEINKFRSSFSSVTAYISFGLLFAFAANAQQSLDVTQLGHYTYSNWNLNDVWGYADSQGNEYALVGVNDGFNVVNVTNSATPTSEIYIFGAYSLWRDIKTWSHYAYVCHDGQFGWATTPDDGILIVDLDSLNTPRYKKFRPTFTDNNPVDSLRTAHNLWIDENGVLYVFGSNLFTGGVLMYDVATDPWNPTYLGRWEEHYLHDGFARGDTLYGAAIYLGGFVIVDVTLKSNPQTKATKGTPNQFAHNCWLSDDGKTLFTTDEINNAYIGAYDISDFADITLVDKIRTNPGTGVIPHNVHVFGDFLVTSYYTSGLNIVDATYPDLLVETGYFDTSPFSGGGYNGAWGAYPYLPSGNILVSDMEEGLFILSSNYTPAARIYGLVVDSLTRTPIISADVSFTVNSFVGKSSITGDFKVGNTTSSFDAISVSKSGYFPTVKNVNFVQGNYDTVVIALLPLNFSTPDFAVENSLKLAPNPCNGTFVAHLSEALKGDLLEATILNMAGQVVYSQQFIASDQYLFSSALPQGVYTITISGNNFIETQKLVIE